MRLYWFYSLFAAAIIVIMGVVLATIPLWSSNLPTPLTLGLACLVVRKVFQVWRDTTKQICEGIQEVLEYLAKSPGQLTEEKRPQNLEDTRQALEEASGGSRPGRVWNKLTRFLPFIAKEDS